MEREKVTRKRKKEEAENKEDKKRHWLHVEVVVITKNKQHNYNNPHTFFFLVHTNIHTYIRHLLYIRANKTERIEKKI